MSHDSSAIQIRDPFIVVDEGRYWLFGSTDANIWTGPGHGFDCYTSTDLSTWEGPVEAFGARPDFWGTENFWAPEAHQHGEHWYLFATFKAPGRLRASHVLRADTAQGPYEPWSAGPITPEGWQCLDATLFVADDGTPWTVFCREWQQRRRHSHASDGRSAAAGQVHRWCKSATNLH